MKTSTIKSIDKVRTWDGGQYGTMYYYTLTLENGETGEVGKKKADAFTVGQEFIYEAVEAVNKATGETYLKFKEVQENPFQGGHRGGKGFGDPKTMLLSYAKDIVVALIAAGKADPNDVVIASEVTSLADAFVSWYNDGVHPIVQGTVPEVEETRVVEENEPIDIQEPEREKPNKGAVVGNLKPASKAQITLLTKRCGERGVNINQYISKNFEDVQTPDELNSWAASYLIDGVL